MKLFLSVVSVSILPVVSVSAGNNRSISSEQKEQAKGLMQGQPACLTDRQVRFLENKGQMSDMEGNPVPFILYKASASGIDMYVTEKGLTYVFIKSEEEKQEALEENSENLESDKEENREIEWCRVDMELKGASIRKENILTEIPSLTDYNYFYAHCPDGIYGAKQYEKITVKNIYPKIDWVLYTSPPTPLPGERGKGRGGFKYDFVVHPGADPKQIQLIYSSKEKTNITSRGTIEIKTSYGNLTEHAPETFLRGELMSSSFKHLSSRENNKGGYDVTIGFDLGTWDRGLGALTIDPQLVWATWYGGPTSADGPMSLDTDNAGNLFITGYTYSIDFPVQTSGTFYQGVFGGGETDAIILKFGNAGNLIWATYYGGSQNENVVVGQACSGIVVDNNGNIFLTGTTFSNNFPLQNSGTFYQGVKGGGQDIFILKFDNNGNRLWATYYGGSNDDLARSIAIDGNGNIFMTGETRYTGFPVFNSGTFFQGATAGGWDVLILKFDNLGNRLWATYYGGSGSETSNAISTDGSGNIFITGVTNSTNFPLQNAGGFFQSTYGGGTFDSFILKFDNAGNSIWATFYGGTGQDWGYGTIADNVGNVYVLGITRSTDFPVQNAGTFFQGANAGGLDAYILKFDNACNRIWASYYGGASDESSVTFDNMEIDAACQNIYLSFYTGSGNMVTRQHCDGGYLDTIYNGGTYDNFLAQFSNTGVLIWATYFGGDGADFRSPLALDPSGNLFVAGEGRGNTVTDATYPLTDPGGGAYFDGTFNGGFDDGIVVKFNSVPFVVTSGSVNAGCGCDGSATVSISGGCAPYNYIWSTGNSTMSVINVSSTISNLCPGSYSVQITESFCKKDTVHFAITSSSNLILTTNIIHNVCNAGSVGTAAVNVNMGIPPYTYSWSNGETTSVITGLSAGTYSVLIEDSAGCDSTLIININEPPAVITSLSVSICPGQTHTLPGGTVVSVNGVYTDTLVSVNGCDSIITTTLTVNPASISSQSISICTGNTHTLPGGTVVSTAGIYNDTLTSANGCDSIINTTLTVNPVSAATRSGSICTGQTYTLPGGTVVSISGVYKDTLTAANGCDSVVTTTLTVNPSQTVTISPNVTITQGSAITLTASGGGSYQWSSGEGTPMIHVSPVQTTTYCVTVTDSNGCIGMACVIVTVEPIDCSKAGELYLPNAFSPNGDGENDDFCLPAGQAGLLGGIEYCIKELKIDIYDRWGEKVYESTEKNFCWDGKNEDKPQNVAVFVYYLEAILISGETITKRGNISLVK